MHVHLDRSMATLTGMTVFIEQQNFLNVFSELKKKFFEASKMSVRLFLLLSSGDA